MYFPLTATAKESSNIIERIAASRKERHESTVEEMHQELSILNSVSSTLYTMTDS